MASGSNNGTIKLWEVNSGRELRSMIGHTSGISSVVFSADSRRIVSGSQDETIKLWDVESGNAVRTFMHGSSVETVAIASDGRSIISGGSVVLDNNYKTYDSFIKQWGVANG